MKLSEIVAYLNLLDSIKADVACRPAMRNLEAVLERVASHPIQLGVTAKELERNYQDVLASIDVYGRTLSSLHERLYNQRATMEGDYFRESQRIFDHEMPFETNQYILDRRLAIDPDSNMILRSHLRNLADWHHPGLIFRPGRENYIEELVPLDPLYVVDHHQELLDPAVQQFTPEYQRRLRQYIIDDRREANILDELPNNSFGLVFAYNFFNYKPLSVIERYLNELFVKCRPGAHVIFTYNNADREQGAGLSERFFMCYTPQRYIRQHADRVGWEYVYSHDGVGDVSWIEFRKPGDLTSLKGGQALAKLVAKPK
jgi:hypothetical protein